MGDPVLLLATTDETSRGVLGSELRRRYGGDYEVVVCADYDHARAVLEGLRRWGRQVALVIAGYGPDDRGGLDFLRRAYGMHPSAKRAVAAIWGDFGSTRDVFSAISHGHAELVLLRPERPRDEEFHGAITDALDDWHLAQGIGFEAVRMIGEQRDERTHATSSAATTSRSASTRSAPSPPTACWPGSASPTPSSPCSSSRSPTRRRRSSRPPTSRSPTPSGS